MDYLKIHNSIVDRAKNRNIDGYKERHHIIPVCLGGLNEKTNLVDLTAKEHWLIHLLLIKIYPDSGKLKMAMYCLTWKSKKNIGRKIQSGKQFEQIRKEARNELIKNRVFTEESRRLIGKAASERLKGSKNHMCRQEQRERFSKNNPMYNETTLKKFLGENNPRARKVKFEEKIFPTVSECIKKLDITVGKFYYMLKKGKIEYL